MSCFHSHPLSHLSAATPEARRLLFWQVLLPVVLVAAMFAAAGCGSSSSPGPSTKPSPIAEPQELRPVPTGPLVTVAPGLSRYTNRRFRFSFAISTALLKPNNAYVTATSAGRPIGLLYTITNRGFSDSHLLADLQVSVRVGAPRPGAVTGDVSVLKALLSKVEAEQAKSSSKSRLVAGGVTEVDGRSSIFIHYHLRDGEDRDLFGYQFFGAADTYGVWLLIRPAELKRYYPAFLTTVRSFRVL